MLRRTLLTLGAVAALLGAMPITPRPARAQDAPGPALTAATRFVDVEGTRIAYRRLGRGAPLVLLQRFRGSMDDWDPALLDALAAGREVILFDSAGVGESGGAVPPTLEGAADVALAVMDALELDRPDLLGWSMGGMTAQILATRNPDRVGRVVLAGTLPPGGSPEVVPPSQAWIALAGKPRYTDEDLVVLFFTQTSAGLAAGRAMVERLSKRRPAAEMKTTPEAMAAQLGAISAFLANEGGWYEQLPTISVPVLVANGDRDGAFPAIDSVILAREIPDAQLAIYPDSGHAFLFQHASRFATDVLAFLDG